MKIEDPHCRVTLSFRTLTDFINPREHNWSSLSQCHAMCSAGGLVRTIQMKSFPTTICSLLTSQD